MVGRDEADGAADVPLPRQGGEALGLVEALGQPEVGELHARAMDRSQDQEVGGLHVAMDVTLGVGVVERREQVTADLRGRRDRQGSLESLGPLQGVLAVHVLHHELVLPVDLEQLVEGHDAGMTLPARHQQVAEDLDLALEVAVGLVADRAIGAHHLDGDRPFLRELSGPENLSHPAAADPFLDEVIGVGLGELHAPHRALVAEPGIRPQFTPGRGEGPVLEVGPILDRDPLAAAGAGRHRRRLAGRLAEMDHERAVPGGDHIPLAELDSLHPVAVDLRAVGAAQVEQMTERRLVLDPEMLARQQHVARHREVNARGPSHHECLPAVDPILQTGMRAGRDPNHHRHRNLPRSRDLYSFLHDFPCEINPLPPNSDHAPARNVRLMTAPGGLSVNRLSSAHRRTGDGLSPVRAAPGGRSSPSR